MKKLHYNWETIQYRYVYQWVVGILCVIFLCLGLHGNFVDGEIQKETDMDCYYANGFLIQAEAGYDGILRLGRDTSIYVTVQSMNTSFEGNVEIAFPDAVGDTISYSKKLSVAENESKCIVFSLPVINQFSCYSVEIKDSYNGSVFYHEYSVEVKSDMESMYVGILSDSMENLSYLAPENAVVTNLSMDSLHDTMSDWNIFDIIVIDDYDMEDMDNELFQNLLTWTKEGGTLFLGTGESYDKIIPRFEKEKILDVTYKESSSRSTLLGLSLSKLNELEQSIQLKGETGNEYSEERLKLEIVDFTVDGSTVIRRDKIPLLEKISLEDGVILLYHVMLGNEQFQNHIISADINETIAAQLSSKRQYDLNYSLYSGNVDSFQMNVVKESSDVEPPSIVSYIVIIVIYILLTGPVLYVVLVKMNRQKLIWLILPQLTVLFLVIVLLGGRNSRITQLKSSYFNVLYYENQIIQESSVFNLTVPYHDEFEVSFDSDTKIQAINHKEFNYYFALEENCETDSIQSCKRKITEGENKTEISLQDLTPYTSKYFTSEKSYTVEGNYESTLHFTVNGFEGGFQNEMGMELQCSFLIGSGSIVALGDIPDGESVDVPLGEGKPMLSCDYYGVSEYVEESINQSTQNSDTILEMSNAMNYVVQEYFGGDTDCNYIVSFVQTDYPEAIANQLSRESDSSGLEILILPVEVNYVEDERCLVPDVGNDYKILEGGFLFGEGYRYLNGTLVVEYHLPEDETITALYYSDYLNTDFNEINYTGFSGNIYLYNRRTNDFDSVFGSYGNEVSNLKDYLDEENTIIIKYKERNDLLDYYMIMPYISYYKEAE